MTIEEVLSRLTVKHRGENNKCLCPVCEGNSGSGHLYVHQDGDKILMSCQHGCDIRDIVNRMGITMRDLFVNPQPQRSTQPKRTARPKQTAPAKQSTQAKHSVREELGTLEATYIYRGEDGKERFRVCRYRNADGKKTFRPYTMDESGRLVSRLDKSARESTLYCLDKLGDEIAKRMVIFVVEGEKDVDNLRALGYAATCNAGGAAAGGSKWSDGHSRLLRGADVVILADMDPERDDDGGVHLMGEKHGLNVARQLNGIAKRVRLCDDLRAYWPQLKDKGDISDILEAAGEEKTHDILRSILRDTPTFDPTVARWWENPMDTIAAKINAVPGYAVQNGCICKSTASGDLVALSDFTATVRNVIIKDNGVEAVPYLEIDGWTHDGEQLPKVIVKSIEYNSMSWVMQHWDLRATITPVNMAEKSLGYIIKKVAQQDANRTTIFTHTGWRNVNGRWCYLHAGGAIGADDVSIDLDKALTRYDLIAGESENKSYADGAQATLMLLDAVDKQVMLPLLGTVFLAPLREFLIQGGFPPSYALFLLGGTGTGKTTAATLALSHFGPFGNRDAPASFRDTANSILRRAFLLKDMPLLVDDLHPTTSKTERDSMYKVLEMVSAASGDGSDRSRLNSNMDVRAATPPRSITIVTGEDMPGGQEGRMARFYIINVKKGQVPIKVNDNNHDILCMLQDMAREGLLRKSMQGYINWILGQIDSLPVALAEEFKRYRERAGKGMDGQHARSAEAVAHVMIGINYMLRYLQSCEVIDTDMLVELSEEAWGTLMGQSRDQARDMMDDRPSRAFVDGMRSLMTANVIKCDNVAGTGDTTTGDNGKTAKLVGFYDGGYYYFIPDLAIGALCEMFSRQGMTFSLSKKALLKMLMEDGYIAKWSKGSKTLSTTLPGKKQDRYICISRSKIDGDSEEEQTELNVDELTEEVK